MIKDGLIQSDNIYGVPFKIDLIPTSNKTARPANKMSAEYITVHNTGNSQKGADAEMHTEYVDTNTDYVSWHFTVDDKEIIQELPITENGWHAGDGRNGTGNRKSIGIEVCENNGIDWVKAKENAIKLIIFLTRNVSTLKPNPVKPHQFWSGKYCPHKILDEGWEKFMNQINESLRNTDELEKALNFLCSKSGISYEHWTKKAKEVEFLDACFIKIAKGFGG